MAAPGTLSTHVLDTSRGEPAEGMRIDLYRFDGAERIMLSHFVTDADGRGRGPLVEAGDLQRGSYELVFHVGAYFSSRGQQGDGPPFLDQVPVRFGVDDTNAGYHVPLLVSPFGYSTYRGS